MADFDEMEDEGPLSEIQSFFRGRSVFVTGATGFMGQVLIEKLLRSCGDLGKLYLLVRPKKGKAVEARMEEMYQGPLFGRLSTSRYNYRQKIVLIHGDMMLPDLGISAQDKQTLLNDVSVVFHIAATVRFDEKLRNAFLMNVAGTRTLVRMARQMTNLKALVYMSTAYANCPEKYIEEKFYPPALDYDKLERICACLDDEQLAILTPGIIGQWPNTYAFTKSISESLIQLEGEGLPVAVVRPSIVVSTAYEPIAGWINNLYGAIGVTVGAATGVLKSLHCKPDILADIVPVDMAINCSIAAAHNVASDEQREDSARIGPIYNYVSSEQAPITWGEYMSYAERGLQWPSVNAIWYYNFNLNSNYYVHMLYVIFWHWGLAIVIDSLAFLTGRKPRLWKLYKKVHKFTTVIGYFTMQQWRFVDSNVQDLWRSLNSTDRRLFGFDMAQLDWEAVMLTNIRGLRMYIVNESFDNVPEAKRHTRKLKVIHYAVLCLAYSVFTYILYRLICLVF